MAQQAIAPARKGDLVVVRRIGDGTVRMVGVVVRWYVGQATKVDREGRVTEFAYPSIGGLARQAIGGRHGHGWGGGLDGIGIYVVSAASIDVAAAMAAVAAHHYAGHPLQPMPFDSLEEAAGLVSRALMPSGKEGRALL